MIQLSEQVWEPAEAAAAALVTFGIVQCQESFLQQPAPIVRLTTATRCHQQLKPFLSRFIAQFCIPRSLRKCAMLKTMNIRLKKCKQMLFRCLKTPPFPPKLGIHPYTQKASLYSDPSEQMDNLHQENVPPAGMPTTSTELWADAWVT